MLDLDQDIAKSTYEDGAFLRLEGDKMVVESTSSGSISRRSSKEAHYCAEPLHRTWV